MNARDSEEITGLLLERGYHLVDTEEAADVILYNTCSVREHAEDRVWSNVGRLKTAKAERPELVIGIMGCMPKAQQKKIFERLPHVDFISGPAQLYEVPDLIESTLVARRKVAAINQKQRSQFQQIPYHAGKVNALVTVMEGCDKVCSYCVVPYTRGPEVSRPAVQVVQEVRALVGAGYKEVMLLGQNVNSYGRRLPGEVGRAVHPAAFDSLLRQVNGVSGIERIRFMTSHPWDAAEVLFAAIRDLEHLCEHLHLPVQSGSDAILERMRRGHTAEHYLQQVALLRRHVPDVAISTDIMVGFPGEGEADFEATVRLMEQVQFDSVFIFKYSPRPFSASLNCKDDMPNAIKDQRLQTLLALQKKISSRNKQAQLGKTFEVLVEEMDGEMAAGRSRTYFKCFFPADGVGLGEVVQVKVEQMRGQSFIGSRVRQDTYVA